MGRRGAACPGRLLGDAPAAEVAVVMVGRRVMRYCALALLEPPIGDQPRLIAGEALAHIRLDLRLGARYIPYTDVVQRAVEVFTCICETDSKVAAGRDIMTCWGITAHQLPIQIDFPRRTIE